MSDQIPTRAEALYMLESPAFDATSEDFVDVVVAVFSAYANGRLIDRQTPNYEAAESLFDDGHRHQSVITQLAELQGICPSHSYGQHNWLPWLEINPGQSWVTRCVACGRVEQWDT